MTNKLEELFDHTAKFAAETFLAQGDLLPMWVAEDSKGAKTLIATPFGSEEEKDLTAATVRKIFKDVGAVRCAFISEAWILASDDTGKMPKDYKMGDPIREHPDRKEVIIVTAEDNVGVSMMGRYAIIRPKGGKPTLGPLEKGGTTTGHGKDAGRFSELLMPEM